MAKTPSTMLALGTAAPSFKLPDTDGKSRSIEDFKNQSLLLVAFICNHCPFVINIKREFSSFAKEYGEKGLAVVAINSNDVSKYPDDSPGKMAEDKQEFAYSFPYLFDEDQSVAKAYNAACTPDFYLFDKDRKLIYRGRFDGSSPSNNTPPSGEDMRKAVELGLKGELVPESEQVASIGCNIKWKSGAEPRYFSH